MRLIKRGIAHPILRNNAFVFAATLVVGLANYLLNTTAARRFVPGQYSQFGIMLNLIGAIAPLSSAIINAVLRRASLNRAAGDPEQTAAIQRTLARHLCVLFLIGIGVIALAHAHIGHFLRLTTSIPLYFVCIAGFWLAIQGPLQGVMQEEGKYGRLSLIFLQEGIFRGVIGVTVILIGLGITVALSVYALSAFFAALLMPWPPAFWRGRRVGFGVMRSVYRDVGQLLLANLCFAVLTSLDVIFCRRYLAPVTADHYVAIAALAKFFLFATASISAIAFAEVVKTAHRGESSRRPLGVSLGLTAALGFPFVLFCALFGPLVMVLMFGDSYRASGHALWITAISAFAMSVVNLEVAYYNARHWLWYLPVFLLGSTATIFALPLAHHSLAGYAGIYAAGASALALIMLAPMLLGLTGRVTIGTAQRVAAPAPASPEPAIGIGEGADARGRR